MKTNNNYHPISATLYFGKGTRIPTGYVVYSVLFYQLNIYFNPLNAELNPVCHLLELLGAHHIFHVSGLRVNIDADYFSFKVPGF